MGDEEDIPQDVLYPCPTGLSHPLCLMGYFPLSSKNMKIQCSLPGSFDLVLYKKHIPKLWGVF